MELVLERRPQDDTTGIIPISDKEAVMLTPEIEEDYWEYRVRLTDTQSILGFPKFTTIGIGFAREEDWNTNLPYSSDADKILNHIWHNAGDESITKADAKRAIEMIQEAAKQDRGK
jgi:hypothetical protein